MFVTHLNLVDFRSYPVVDVPLEPGVTVFTGPNGQGKTNLVEAVEYLATLGSHRVASEAPLVRFGAERSRVRARVQAGADDPRQLLLEVELIPGKANRASLNRAPLKRPRDLLGALRVVVFSPEDLTVVKGDPSSRRRFLDELLTARWPRLAGVRADYDRVLKQRSTLLKSLAGRGPRGTDAESTLGVWDEKLAQLGAEIVEARLSTLADLTPLLQASYAGIAPTRNLAEAAYQSSSLPTAADLSEPGAESQTGGDEGGPRAVTQLTRAELGELLLERMRQRRGEEIARGLSLVGPHRDDVALTLSGLPARGYASHGESWSLALALRLASFGLLREDGVEPVLILDDVFAELDEVRRDRLAAVATSAEQVLITAAVSADVPASLGGRHYTVELGHNPVPASQAAAPEPEAGDSAAGEGES
ncbi:MAG: DNA replication/repair protein RecF [Actinobacteria bacterium]|nr:DNA replication/repair protein RecF [Actinomycetota bacterium]